MIRETIVTTRAGDRTQIVPLGVRRVDGLYLLAPFRPSTTLDHLLTSRVAVINHTDDVRVFAGCLTGRYDWPTTPAQQVACDRLADSLAHSEVELIRVEEDVQRPRLYFREVHHAVHRAFEGFNRAQAAVIEAAILVSRLGMLPPAKITAEMAYLTIAVDKTAGTREREAWEWLQAAVESHLSRNGAS
jgi:uncharacterized protein